MCILTDITRNGDEQWREVTVSSEEAESSPGSRGNYNQEGGGWYNLMSCASKLSCTREEGETIIQK